MKKIKELITVIFIFIFFLYWVSIPISATYFIYKDIKNNNSFVRYLFISPLVGLYKGTHWPYYAFFENKQNIDSSVFKISSSIYESFQIVNNFNNRVAKAYSEKSLLELSLAYHDAKNDLVYARSLVDESNTAILENVYEGWGESVEKLYIKSLDMLIENLALGMHSSDAELLEADELMSEYVDWMRTHWPNIATILNNNR